MNKKAGEKGAAPAGPNPEWQRRTMTGAVFTRLPSIVDGVLRPAPDFGLDLINGRFKGGKGELYFFRQSGEGRPGSRSRFAANLGREDDDGEAHAADATIRRELAGAGHWLPVIVTDAGSSSKSTSVVPIST